MTRASRFLIGLVSECPGILAAERQARRLLRRCTIVTATAGLSPGAAVLEVGCGTGQLTERLASSGFRLTAIDIGASMIAAARQRLAGAEVSFQVTSFEDLAAVDASFDLVISSAAFHWIDPEVAFSKSARLLRPGGWLALLGTEEHYDDPLGEALDVLWVTHGDTGGAWERRPSDPEAFGDDREPDVAIPQPAPERAANLQFFLASDAPAAHRYQLDIPALKAAAAKIVPAAGLTSRDAFPHRCAESLAEQLGRELVEFPGGHSGYALRPRAFAAALDHTLSRRGATRRPNPPARL